MAKGCTQSKENLEFIDGTLRKPELKEGDDPSEFEAWDMVNSLVCSWLINMIDPKLHASVAYTETAKAM